MVTIVTASSPWLHTNCRGSVAQPTASAVAHLRVKPEVLSHPERFSLICSRHRFIVPGGHFVEFYCRDSYWVMEGLLLSEMPGTVKGVRRTSGTWCRCKRGQGGEAGAGVGPGAGFALALVARQRHVSRYGRVSSGACMYHLQRSQPRVLTLMMDRHVTHTNDTPFLRLGNHLQSPGLLISSCANVSWNPLGQRSHDGV
ncbi:hypothetical protein CB1_000200037 [Camelus ferus]|nr:hypothetical protein CB1_000200037 [Camelus ferus]